MILTIDGHTIALDEDGYLEDRSVWNEDIAQAMADADGIELSDNHWEVLRLLQDYYSEYQIAPNVRVLTKQIGKRLGKDKGNSLYLYELFPRGPALQACRYAGLPRPTGCT